MDHRLTTPLFLFLFFSTTITLGLLIFSGGDFSLSLRPSSLTGAVVADTSGESTHCIGRGCTIACSASEDCDDGVQATQDVCRNPGTSFSLCVNLPPQE